MLIGNKEESGGGRWVVSGFPDSGFSDSPTVRRLVVGLPDSGFSTGPRVSRWEVAGFGLGPFSDSPLGRRWDTSTLPFGHFGGSPSGQSLGVPFWGFPILEQAAPLDLIRG